jgi:hypothetical protein
MKRVNLYRYNDDAIAATVGTVLLVIITVALVIVVSMFAFQLVNFPEDPPELDVVYTHLNDRWSVHFNDASEEVRASDFRLVAYHPDGSFVTFDPDADSTADTLMVFNLDDISTSTGGGQLEFPVMFLDIDQDGRISSGDMLVAQAIYVPSQSLFLDASRGFKQVGMAPHGIPLGSDLTVVANPTTLPGANLQPGDEVNIEFKHGGFTEATVSGHASGGGSFITSIHLEPPWHLGNHKALFTVRPGEVDEFSAEHHYKVVDPEPISEEEEKQYDDLKRPLRQGDVVSLIHTPSNSVVLTFTL